MKPVVFAFTVSRVLGDLAGKMGTTLLYHLLGCSMSRWLPLGCATEQTLLSIHMSWFAFLTHSTLLEDRWGPLWPTLV